MNSYSRNVIGLGCVLLFSMGVIGAGLGPSLSALALNTESTIKTVGLIFTAIFGGAMASQFFVGFLLERFGMRPVLLGGMLLLMVGSLGFTTAPNITLFIVAGFIAGLGQGALDVGVNLTIALMDEKISTMGLNLSNMFYGVGAVVSPAIISVAIRGGAPSQVGVWIGIVLLGVVLIPVALTVRGKPPKAQKDESGRTNDNPYRSPLLWGIGLMILIYVGVEQGLGGWTTRYISLTTLFGEDTGALLSSGFWLALTVGRLLATLYSPRTTPQRLLGICMVGSLAGGILYVLSVGNFPLTVFASLLLGLSFGPIFPTTFALVTNLFRHGSGRAAALVIACGSVGGLGLVYIQGEILNGISPLAGAFYVAVTMAAMFGLFVAVSRAVRPRSATYLEAAPIAE